MTLTSHFQFSFSCEVCQAEPVHHDHPPVHHGRPPVEWMEFWVEEALESRVEVDHHEQFLSG